MVSENFIEIVGRSHHIVTVAIVDISTKNLRYFKNSPLEAPSALVCYNRCVWGSK